MTDRLVLPGQPLAPASAAVTVGTFDGVHRGHQAVLKRLLGVSQQEGLRSVVVTFDPHPLRVLRPDAERRQLCTTAEKIELLQTAGVDQVSVVNFTKQLAGYPPRRFVEDVLLAHFGLAHLVTGYDHGFGKDRSGDAATLQTIGGQLGFAVTVVPHTDLDARPISSTRIRLLLADGDVGDAARALGRAYSASGIVVTGDRRGRELGFPTANLRIAEAEKLLPAEGIYAVLATLQGEATTRRAVMHLGPRPTFPGAPATLEVHLLDFTGDLYDRRMDVQFCARLRGVERFASVEALIAAMHADVERARQVFGAGSAGCSGAGAVAETKSPG